MTRILAALCPLAFACVLATAVVRRACPRQSSELAGRTEVVKISLDRSSYMMMSHELRQHKRHKHDEEDQPQSDRTPEMGRTLAH